MSSTEILEKLCEKVKGNNLLQANVGDIGMKVKRELSPNLPTNALPVQPDFEEARKCDASVVFPIKKDLMYKHS